MSIVEFDEPLPPPSLHLLWGPDDADPALAHVLAMADEALPRES